ncbi:uncharacterized protein ARMOST_15886 [Armillaria ostoyae]|uniref:Uncharacterized protein n=1 Tax=Armillaria ostoyae TaxID=47428 RepID=A0A284RUL1_ARMOS|nr:uncharacterized protein ARMOST_15886 [Armillaria ostoyae]
MNSRKCKDRILPREDDNHRVLVVEGKTSSSFSTVTRGELYRSGGGQRARKHARGDINLSDQHGGSIGEHFTVLPNSSDIDALRARFCAETSIVEGGRPWTCRECPNIVPFCARPTSNPQGLGFKVSRDVDVRVPKPVSASGRRVVVPQSAGCRSEEGLKEMVVIEETATRMPDPPSSSDNSPSIRLYRCWACGS